MDPFGHHLLLGRTGYGKSSWLFRLLAPPRARRRKVVVLNPKPDTRWAEYADLDCGADLARWIGTLQASDNLEAVFDDTTMLRRIDPEALSAIAATCSSRGHRLYLAGHLATSVPPIARGSCSQLWCFNQPGSEAKELSREWGVSELEDAVSLQPFECLWVAAGRPGAVRFNAR